jgi:ABC-type multidrug transport system fused ATPase/permease subunit
MDSLNDGADGLCHRPPLSTVRNSDDILVLDHGASLRRATTTT